MEIVSWPGSRAISLHSGTTVTTRSPSSAAHRLHRHAKPAREPLRSRSATLTAWLVALLTFAGVVALFLHVSELEQLGRLLRHIRWRWLLVAAGVQGLTYFCAAGVWLIALPRRNRHNITITSLVPIALAMLFTNQAFPTAGLSGSLIVVRALRKRHVASDAAMGALFVGLMTTYLAYLLAVIVSLALLLVYHAVSLSLVLLAAIFSMAAVGVPAAIVWYRESIAPKLRTRLTRVPIVGGLLKAVGRFPTRLLHDRQVLERALTFQLAEIVLDAATLQVMLISIGASAAPTGVLASFVMAYAVSQLVPVPLGLGTFEAALVGMLHLVGIPLEPAFAATLLLRAFTFWLPMVPGLWFAHREFVARRG